MLIPHSSRSPGGSEGLKKGWSTGVGSSSPRLHSRRFVFWYTNIPESGISQNASLYIYTADVPGELHPSIQISPLLPGEHRIGARRVHCFIGNFHHIWQPVNCSVLQVLASSTRILTPPMALCLNSLFSRLCIILIAYPLFTGTRNPGPAGFGF